MLRIRFVFLGVLVLLVLSLLFYLFYYQERPNSLRLTQVIPLKEHSNPLVAQGEVIEKVVAQIIEENVGETSSDRQNELLIAMRNSAIMREIPKLKSSDLEMALEYIKVLSKWFIETNPPSERERQQILSQIDYIISMVRELCLKRLPGIPTGELKRYLEHLRTIMINHYQDDFDPTLKRPLSQEELADLLNKLNEEIDRAQLELRHSIRENDPFEEQKKAFINHILLSRLCLSARNWVRDVYRLPPSERMLELDADYMADWKRKVNEKHRRERIRSQSAPEFITSFNEDHIANSTSDLLQANEFSSSEELKSENADLNVDFQMSLDGLEYEIERKLQAWKVEKGSPMLPDNKQEVDMSDKYYEDLIKYYSRMLDMLEHKGETPDNPESKEGFLSAPEYMSPKIKSWENYWLSPYHDEDNP